MFSCFDPKRSILLGRLWSLRNCYNITTMLQTLAWVFTVSNIELAAPAMIYVYYRDGIGATAGSMKCLNSLKPKHGFTRQLKPSNLAPRCCRPSMLLQWLGCRVRPSCGLCRTQCHAMVFTFNNPRIYTYYCNHTALRISIFLFCFYIMTVFLPQIRTQ